MFSSTTFCNDSNLDTLDECGFETEDFGNGTVIVRTVPVFADDTDITPLIDEIASGNMRVYKDGKIAYIKEGEVLYKVISQDLNLCI